MSKIDKKVLVSNFVLFLVAISRSMCSVTVICVTIEVTTYPRIVEMNSVEIRRAIALTEHISVSRLD